MRSLLSCAPGVDWVVYNVFGNLAFDCAYVGIVTATGHQALAKDVGVEQKTPLLGFIIGEASGDK